MRLVFTCIFCFTGLAVFGQTRGVVTVLKDPNIDSLISKRFELNKKSADITIKPNGPVVSQMGYRVQIYYGSDRRAVFKEQSKFNALYPKLITYVTYREPNYYLRAGDFRTRMEAQKLMSELRPMYPTLFIFREKINAPTLDYSND